MKARNDLQALSLQLGHNATLGGHRATLLDRIRVTAAFCFCVKRALVSDAVAHGTLPDALAFITISLAGGRGFLPG